jgi:hypothetical protein
MDKFRLPRKIKKELNKSMFLYPPDAKGSSLMASPARIPEDYVALLKGIVKRFPDTTKSERKLFHAQLDKEIFVDDQILKTYINDILRDNVRISSYYTLIDAKKHPNTIKAYYNFINAYHLYNKGDDSYGNICCMAIDHARELLKKHRRR